MNRTFRPAWAAAAFVTTLAYLFLHQGAQRLVQGWRAAWGADIFANVFLALGFGVLALVLVFGVRATVTRFARERHQSPIEGSVLPVSESASPNQRPGVLALWALFVVAALVTHYFLVAVDSELIHWLQFGLLYWLFLGATGRIGGAAAWTTLAGVLDEAYQYWVLQFHWNTYFDFNDILLNAVGAGLSLCLALSFARVERHPFQLNRVIRQSAFVVVAALAVFLVATLATSIASLYKSSNPDAWYVLSRADADPTFWTVAEWARGGFHILSPAAGLAASFAALGLFLALDGWYGFRLEESTSTHP